MTAFPVSNRDATVMNLIYEPLYHGPLTKAQTSELLKNDGDFLIQSSNDNQSFMVCVRKGRVHGFLVSTAETLVGVLFKIDRTTFHSFDALINHLLSENMRVKNSGMTLCFTNPIPKVKRNYRLGVRLLVDCEPRVSKSTSLPIFNKSTKLFIVPLRKEIITDTITEQLEDLCKLRNKYVVELLDYQTYLNFNNLIVLLKFPCYQKPVADYFKKEDISRSYMCKIIKQAAEGMKFLADNGLTATIVTPFDSFIDNIDNLKIGGAWKETWPTYHQETFLHSFYWRYLAPEAALLNTFGSSSLMYNFGVFAWHLSMKCSVLPFSYHDTFSSFFQVIDHEELMFPGKRRTKFVESLVPDLGFKVLNFKKKVDSCDFVPDALREMMIAAVSSQCYDRPSWLRVIKITSTASTIDSIVSSVKTIFPFV